MAYLIVGLIALLALLGLLRLFADAKPGQIKTAAVWGGGLLGAVLLVALLASGRGPQALWALALFGPMAWRWIQGLRAARTFARAGRPSDGQASDVETGYLAMGLDHDSGRMFGRVKAGRYAGRELSDLDEPLLLDLLAELSVQDPEGVPLLEAWLDRAHADWREQARAQAEPPPRRPPSGRMTREEALAVLGLAEGADAAAIRTAHRRLMRANHPDQGGSDWLASRLNEARDVLLG
ncbi:molecular chaperone DnaJ [Roseomonas sp. AR75]|uniref:molecular chaperone DnaJ n=1 Tax=Roseomonas sp. AR75 TaxID=2562311 RepID=UPI0010C139F5|nr:molecular chaperone DnaJ [Roseomonas sp. AR75]